jgi:LysM repeat protein
MAFRNKKFELSPRLKSGVGRGYSQNQILKFAAIICLVVAVILFVDAIKVMISSNNPAASGAVLGASDIKSLSTQQNQTSTNQFTQYTIQKGDTLFSISQKYNINWATLATVNNLTSPFYLQPGEILKIPNQ